ncbi:MAG: DUF3841 domain-containing protein [Candidatus Coatesbacteria bacterium]
MTLWTVQTHAAWRGLRRTGRLRGDGRRCWRFNRPAYRWMAEQMVRRGFLRPGRLPIWAWRTPKPDLRHRALLSSGTKGVRIELDVSPARVLLSEFDAWHCVLNRGFLPLSDREDDAFDRRCKRRTAKSHPRWEDLPDDLRAATRQSWERIFDLERLQTSAIWKTGRHWRYVQATIAEIRLADVVEAVAFVSRA